MTYTECLDYIYGNLPMFHRIGAAAYKADLSTTISLCEHLGNPQNNFKSIHIAGTNGKGSVSNMLAAVLQSAGYKTGLFTSPHLKDFRERIRMNGAMIHEDEVVDFMNRNLPYFDILKPSFFEMSAALAFDYFSKNQVEIAVIETGMGGRLDSTNLVTPVVSVITNIGMDHTQFLGDTPEKIAVEKAGIIKPAIPVVIGQTQQETKQVFTRFAQNNNSSIFFADQNFSVLNFRFLQDYGSGIEMDVHKNGEAFFGKLKCQLSGIYQQKNIVTVLQTIDVLNDSGFKISDENIRSGLSSVCDLTGLKGRWQVLSKNPLIICDTGHNSDGITEVIRQIDQTPHKKLHFVLGMVSDKDILAILKLLPVKASYYFCKPNVPRGLDAGILADNARNCGLYGEVFNSVNMALQSAIQHAKENDLIMVGGSTFVVAEVV